MQEQNGVPLLLLPSPKLEADAYTKPVKDREVKPKKPGILAESLSPNEKLKKLIVDDLIVFGQGPVIDVETKAKPDQNKKDVRVEAISWMKTVARAAGELKKAGVVRRIILTGGSTGGSNFPSEAELMRDILKEEYGLVNEDIVLEKKATNTLENFAYTLNELDQAKKEKPEEHRTTAVLGIDPQLARIKLLADLFGLPVQSAFSAEEIFRLIAYKTNDQELHRVLDTRLKIDEDLSFPESRFSAGEWRRFLQMSSQEQVKQPTKSTLSPTVLTEFEQQHGEERKGIRRRKTFEAFLTRGTIEVPEFWFGYLSYLNNQRLRTILLQTDQNILDRFGIQKNMPIEDIRDILRPYAISKDKTGKRIGLEEFYGLKEEDDKLVLAQAKVGTSAPVSPRDQLEKLASS